jgi:hypothetical protein
MAVGRGNNFCGVDQAGEPMCDIAEARRLCEEAAT